MSQSTTTNVTTLNPIAPAATNGTSFAAPFTDLGVGSTATISASPISSDGSLHLTGDRSRVLNNLSGLNIAADTVESLTADYVVTTNTNQSPAFRVYVRGADNRTSQLIWEAAYNGGFTPGTLDTVQAGDMFWQYVGGAPTYASPNTYLFHTLADWGDLLGGIVTSVGVGQGSGAGATFDAYADNLTLNTTGASRAYNFATAVAAVPEPATWAMMLVGFGGIGGAMRRSRRQSRALQVA